MVSEKPVASANGADESDLATAFQELAKGERTATALENQLSSMEAKIEALLAQAEKDQQEALKEAQRAKAEFSTASANAQGEEKKEVQ